MIGFDAATALVGWAAGGWFFLWVTTRRREVGLGYGWLMRVIFLALAGGSLATALSSEPTPGREAATVAFIAVGLVAAASSVARRSAGTSGQREVAARRSARVSAMTGADGSGGAGLRRDAGAPEFWPGLDLAAASVGLAAALLGAASAGGPAGLSVARTLVGALFVGAVADAMLLGHWYLVQPGLTRAPLRQMVRASGLMWVPETVVLLWPTGMVSVLDGTIDDGYNGLLGWFWLGCTAATVGLVAVAGAALRERQYSAVMAATGLMYLAIVTALGQDLVARILLAR